MRRATQKTNLISKGSFSSVENEYSLNNSSDLYETPQNFGKQIRQRTYECNKNFPKSKDMQCAIINHQICQRLNSPTTHTTMSRIIDRYSSRIVTVTSHECNDSQVNATPYEHKVSNLVKSVMQIQKYKWSKTMPKFHEYVKELKEKYSVQPVIFFTDIKKETTWQSYVAWCEEECCKLLPKQQDITTASI